MKTIVEAVKHLSQRKDAVDDPRNEFYLRGDGKGLDFKSDPLSHTVNVADAGLLTGLEGSLYIASDNAVVMSTVDAWLQVNRASFLTLSALYEALRCLCLTVEGGGGREENVKFWFRLAGSDLLEANWTYYSTTTNQCNGMLPVGLWADPVFVIHCGSSVNDTTPEGQPHVYALYAISCDYEG